MRVCFLGNCQVAALKLFVERALPHHEYRCLKHFATDLGEFSKEQISEASAWADLVFFHKKIDDDNEYPSKQPKVYLPVWYQSAPFIDFTPLEDWKVVEDRYRSHGMEEACRFAVQDADMNYEKRWQDCLDHQIRKEKEDVPEELWISHLMERGREIQLQTTQNHPTSIVLREWALRICKFLGEKPAGTAVSEQEAYQNINIANLPCIDNVTTGARKALGLLWSSRPDADELGKVITRMHLEKLPA